MSFFCMIIESFVVIAQAILDLAFFIPGLFGAQSPQLTDLAGSIVGCNI
jgi:hypothetical protein